MGPEVAAAVAVLRQGGLVAFPTETVYGVGADARNAAAVARIFAAKGRPPGRPLTVHLGPSADPAAWGAWERPHRALAERFWPGPLTLVVPRIAGVPDVVTGGLHTVGLRVPSHPLCMALLDRFGGGVAATSANRSGHVSPTLADHVRAELGDRVDLVLDGGACPVGIESTVLSLAGPPTVLRLGAVSIAALRELVPGVRVPDEVVPRVAPRARLRLVPADALDDVVADLPGRVAVIASHAPRGAHRVDPPADAEAWARGLYRMLRELDEGGFDTIVVAELPRGGLWDAVTARLRAAEASA